LRWGELAPPFCINDLGRFFKRIISFFTSRPGCGGYKRNGWGLGGVGYFSSFVYHLRTPRAAQRNKSGKFITEYLILDLIIQ